MGVTRIAYHSANSKLAKHKIPLLIGKLAKKGFSIRKSLVFQKIFI